jgi:ubiquinone/menaquinone biosynthesis C-methylase UbiE
MVRQAMRLRKFVVIVAFAFALGPAALLAQLASRPPEEWIKTLESPDRIAGLKINETIAALKLKPGQTVADVGAGTGIFSIPLGSAVKPGGKVYAVDIDQAFIHHIDEKAAEVGLTNVVQGVLGGFTDPNLPADVDLAFMHDTLHHIEDRAGYLKTLALYLKPGARIAVIDFKPNQGGHRDQPELQTSQQDAAKWMAAAGLKPLEEINLFSDKWFVIYGK